MESPLRMPRSKIDKKRLDEIVRTLARYGLAEWLGKDIPDLIEKRLVTADGRSISDMSQEERIREAFTELGTTFIKLGQVLSTRADLVGPVLSEELSKLQADVPADPPEPIVGADLVVWYVAKLQNDDTPGDEYCWADTALVDGAPSIEVWPCYSGPMFVPIAE